MSSSSTSRFSNRFDALGFFMVGLCAAMVIGFYFFRSLDRAAYYAFIKEDSVAEYIQAGCLLLSSLTAVLISRKLFAVRQTFLGLMFAIFACGTFLLFGEEISWGQRIFGWQSGDYFQATNMQKETNVHNSEHLAYIVHPVGIAIGIYAVMSALLHISFVRRGAKIASYFTTEWPVAGYFAVFTGIYIIYEYLNPYIRPWYGYDFILWRDLEMAESFFTAGIFFWTVLKLRSVDRLFGAPAAPAAFAHAPLGEPARS